MTAPWPFEGLERGAYGAICADPPWAFRGYTERLSDRDVQRHYTTMSLAAIKELPVRDLAASDAHLFLWATGPHLPLAFEVITAWGFRYSGVAFTWVKLRRGIDGRQTRLLPAIDADLHLGLGFTTRKNTEVCLLARRGNARRIAKNIREIIMAPVREHSRKPDEAFDRVRAYCAGPYLELFSRQRRPGWASWGDSVDHFPAQQEGRAA